MFFGILGLGLPSAVVKCYHRDCETRLDRTSILATTLALEAPVLLIVGSLLFIFAENVGTVVIELGITRDEFEANALSRWLRTRCGSRSFHAASM